MPVNATQTPTENDVYRYYGTKLMHSMLAGGAIGAGGMGLYRLLKDYKNEQEQKNKQQASLSAVSAEPPSFVTNKIANAADLVSSLALPVSGAGAGALYGAMTAEKGKKLKGALRAGLVGGAAGTVGAGIASPNAAEMLGRSMPHKITDVIPFHRFFPSEKYTAPTSTYQAAAYLLPVLAGTAGVYGGASAVNALTADDHKAKNKDNVQSARDAYFKTLLDEPDEEKVALNAGLDKCYALYEKKSNENENGGFLGWLQNTISPPNPAYGPNDGGWLGNTVKNTLAAPQLLSGAALLGGGALGAKYMYDKTRANSQEKLLRASRAARERLHGLDAPWVDPVELASIKELANKKELTSARGM